MSTLAGLARDHVRLIETGQVQPTDRTKTRLAEALGFAGSSRIWFLHGIGQRPARTEVAA